MTTANAATNSITDGRHDFDFLAGTWHVHHRKLADMTDPACSTWVEFEGVQWMRQTLGGLGNVDNLKVDRMPDGRSFEGMSVRLFDVSAGLWRIWWASTSAPGHLDPPVSGRWEGGRGLFEGTDVVGGRPVDVRFEWSVDSADSAQWEQSFSFDGGRSRVRNWRMSFTRLS